MLLNEALLFIRFSFNSDRDILMKITLSRFKIRESLVFRDLSCSPRPFFVCTKLFLTPTFDSLSWRGFLSPFKNMRLALRPHARCFDISKQNYYRYFDKLLCVTVLWYLCFQSVGKLSDVGVCTERNPITLEIPYNEKLEHQRSLCIERERDPLHILLVSMRCYAHYMMRAVSLSVMPCE